MRARQAWTLVSKGQPPPIAIIPTLLTKHWKANGIEGTVWENKTAKKAEWWCKIRQMSCLELTDAEIIKIAEPMMDDVMLGVSRRDYALHASHFSVNLKSKLGSDEFLSACDQRDTDWGLPGHRELVSIFRKHKSFTLIWNQQYTRTDEEVIAMTTIALKGGRYFVDYFLLH